MWKFFHQLGRAIEAIFEKIGLEALPKPLKIGIFVGIFALPVLGMIYVIFFWKDVSDEVFDQETKKLQAKQQKGKREKVE